jgi:hypothetical protein
MAYRNLELYVNRVREALLRLAIQGRLEDALPHIEGLEEMGDEDSSESGGSTFSTLGRDELLPALPRLQPPPSNPFVEREDTGVMTSAAPVPTARPSQNGVSVQKTCPMCSFVGELTRCPHDGHEMLL